ncbi:hypothetical protein YC2023_019282 [Brassica napus]
MQWHYNSTRLRLPEPSVPGTKPEHELESLTPYTNQEANRRLEFKLPSELNLHQRT